MWFTQILQKFIDTYIPKGSSISMVISFSTQGKTYPVPAIGQSIGYVVEETIAQLIEKQLEKFIKTNKNLLPQGVSYVGTTHNTIGSPIDFSFHFKTEDKDLWFIVDSKSEIKYGNTRATKAQANNKDNPNAYVIYSKYALNNSKNTVTIQEINIVTFKNAFNVGILRESYGESYSIWNPRDYIKVSLIECNKSKKTFKALVERKLRTLSETLQYLSSTEALLEAKKRVQVKKFIEQNFTKRGDYVFPKDGNSKCSLHQEYDKGLLRFFAEHGITKIMSAFGNNVPSLGYSASEEKWYGWSHRAIYGFKVGDKIKKGTCGYEEMKKRGLLNIKTEEQAKEVAKVFAEDVS